jgi:disulfide bond formation protein DsbB
MKFRLLQRMALLCGLLGSSGGILISNDSTPIKLATVEPTYSLNSISHNIEQKVQTGTDLHSQPCKMTITLLTASKTSACQSTQFTISISRSSEDQYMLGYYGEGDMYLPLTFNYNVKHEDGTSSEASTIMAKKNGVADFDGIGVNFNNDSGSTSVYSFKNRLNIFLDKPTDSVDFDSLVATNIFAPTRSKKDDGSYTPYVPVTTTPYYVSTPDSYFDDSSNYKFDDFGSIQLDSINSYEGQISFVCSYDFTKCADQMKNRMDSSDYEEGMTDVKNGVCGIRYRLYNFTSGRYRVLFKDGTYSDSSVQVANANGASSLALNETTGKLVFMIDSATSDGTIDFRSISNFYLEDITIRLEFYILTTNKSSSSAQTVDTVFGAIDTNQASQNINYFNYVAIFWLFVAIVAIVFAALALALYFYRKKKYRNDEFLRVDTKKYIFTSLRFFLCTEILAIEGFYIFVRFNAFNNTPIVANPTDKWIIIFLVASVIVIGYLIKFGITSYKTHKEMKKMDLLKVNDDVIDDGTVQLAKQKKVIKEAK